MNKWMVLPGPKQAASVHLMIVRTVLVVRTRVVRAEISRKIR